ncbi:MAG: HEAT repeat domain-containing protein [Planctomycetes bacterium]|nr:HEAT repeat domain-containing protein [Planctomycetota bacterium]
MSCEDFLSRWDDGDRSPEVAAHVAACPECSSLLAVDARVKAARIRVVSGEGEFVERLRSRLAPARRPWVRLAAAAAVLAAVGAALFADRRGTEPVVAPAVPGPVTAAKEPAAPGAKPFRDRLVEAAAGIGRDEFLAGLRQGVERARLTAAFRSDDPEERAAAVRVAGVLKDPTLAAELAYLASRNDLSAIAALGEIGGVESVAVLAALAGAPERRAAVERALAATGRPEAAEALAAMGAWKNAAAWAVLGEAAAPALAARLRAGGEARAAAFVAAAWARPAALVPELARLLPRAATREAAARTLRAIGGPKATESLALAAVGAEDPVTAALRTPEGRGALERRMLDARLKPLERGRAARTLGLLGDPEAVAGLERALGAPEVRAEAVAALGALRSDKAVPALAALLGDRKSRSAAAAALARIGSPDAIPALAAAARDRSFSDEAVRAIAAIESPRAVPVLLDALANRETAVLAMEALARLKDPRAIVPLIGALDGEHSKTALESLHAITGQKLPARKTDWLRWLRTRPKEGASLGSRNA